jgi:hypothetical protein
VQASGSHTSITRTNTTNPDTRHLKQTQLPHPRIQAKAEPATLRYQLLHAAARLVRHSRHLILRIPETWPWAKQFADALNRVRAIP